MSNRTEWTAEQVVGGYGGQQPVEKIFRGLKDGDWLNWGPMYHWTDSKSPCALHPPRFTTLLGALRVQPLPAAELYDLGADDASNRLTREEPLKDVEADVPARGAPRENERPVFSVLSYLRPACRTRCVLLAIGHLLLLSVNSVPAG
jgi:hypothetical protein